MKNRIFLGVLLMIDAVLSLLKEDYRYICDAKARELYIRFEFRKLEEEIGFLEGVNRKGRRLSTDYHVELQSYICQELSYLRRIVDEYGTDEQEELFCGQFDKLQQVYRHYFFKSQRLFVV